MRLSMYVICICTLCRRMSKGTVVCVWRKIFILWDCQMRRNKEDVFDQEFCR